MRKLVYFLISGLILSFSISYSYAQGTVAGIISDETGIPLPFVTIRLGGTKDGIVADINGKFSVSYGKGVTYLECSYIGYQNYILQLPAAGAVSINMQPSGAALTEVVISPPYEKIKRILNNAIANRDKHNPEKYDWYQCNVYYKMSMPFSLPENVLEQDTSADTRSFQRVTQEMNLMMSETYSRRTWKKPQRLQEEVITTRFSGLKKSLFTSLVTDVLPFHSYSDYLRLNNYDYHNPLSKGFFNRYSLNIIDEVYSGKDTVWAISFKPKNGAKELKGVVFINSDEYAISSLIAQATDTQLKRTTRIEQQYTKESGRWFPLQLNFKTDFTLKQDSANINFVVKGSSQIDSVNYVEDEDFHFDRVHTVKMLPDADERNDSLLQQIRPMALTEKEQRTYEFIDSFSSAQRIDKYIPYAQKIITEWKFPLGPVDFDLKRLIRQNTYEKLRVGLGLQTNEKICSWMSLGGWAGYGFKDKAMKYGGFLEFYGDKYREFVIKLSYDNDLVDPGRVQLHRELDKAFFRNFLLTRVDKNEQYAASVKKQFGYLSAELTGRFQKIIPQYTYSFTPETGISYSRFDAREINLGLRYAFAERSVPAFGRYFKTDVSLPKYPVLYARFTAGNIYSGTYNANYQQVVGALRWEKHFNRFGNEKYLLTAGYIHTDKPLPLSKLFAGNGYSSDSGSSRLYSSFYSFGGIRTMSPYQYYTDQFVSFCWQHDFNFRFFRTVIARQKISMAPSPSIAYNGLWGRLADRQAQQSIDLSVPNDGYHEVGLLVRDLFKSVYQDLIYINFTAGYYQNIPKDDLLSGKGQFIFGLSAEF